MVIQRVIGQIRECDFTLAVNGDQAVREVQANMSKFHEYQDK